MTILKEEILQMWMSLCFQIESKNTASELKIQRKKQSKDKIIIRIGILKKKYR